ncbi:histidine kinase [Pedobacter ginsengisoli]|uniref:histidine kinase n=1 Tax=Pedobacter ginsengisoli TaxID=363852 RepID=A0A2D1U2Q8_9SPHI|nr:HAMP domain-containing sensor histidine kinase [Pedobacter ginsengisoli]ATP55879.1 histidine kinase [Pedobacter ginsengisoli]
MAIESSQSKFSIEDERIKALHRYEILDTPPDGSFDKLTKLAAKLFDVPIVIISIVDKDRIWFKSKYGVDIEEVSREVGLCANAVLSDGLYTNKDTLMTLGGVDLKFYAALPLKTIDNFNLGAFCILDKEPRTFGPEQEAILCDLRDIVMDQIELKLASRLAGVQTNQILNTTAHDLKNPLTTIPVRADLIKLKKNDPELVDKMCEQIKTASLNMVRIIDELLLSGTAEAGKVQLLFIKLNLSSLVNNVISMNLPLAERKNQSLKFVAEDEVILIGDEGKLSEILDNLINNAIKYSPVNTSIEVRVKKLEGRVLIKVKDEGQGLTDDDKNKLYQRFTRLSAQPTGGENSTGLGLSIVRVLVEAHGGRIWAESDGHDKGSTFIVELPLQD